MPSCSKIIASAAVSQSSLVLWSCRLIPGMGVPGVGVGAGGAGVGVGPGINVAGELDLEVPAGWLANEEPAVLEPAATRVVPVPVPDGVAGVGVGAGGAGVGVGATGWLVAERPAAAVCGAGVGTGVTSAWKSMPLSPPIGAEATAASTRGGVATRTREPPGPFDAVTAISAPTPASAVPRANRHPGRPRPVKRRRMCIPFTI
jgi:hypothetical protein